MLTFFSVCNWLGYGIHSYGLMNAIDKRGVEVALVPVNGQIVRRDKNVERWVKNAQASKIKDPAIMLYHENFLRQFTGKPRIGFPVFEVDKFSEYDLECMRTCDYLLCTSEWAKGILSKHDIVAHVVPEGHDDEVFYPAMTVREATEDMKERIKFIHVGKYEVRKSSDEVLEAYTFAIAESQRPTTLVYHVLNPFIPNWKDMVDEKAQALGWRRNGAIQTMVRYMLGKHELLVPLYPFQNQFEMAQVMSQSHFGLFAPKAEGWGLPILESMACGLPTFTTAWTGLSEFVKREDYLDCFLFLNGSEVEARDGVWFHGYGEWYEPDMTEMEQKIKDVLAFPEQSYILGREKALAIAKKYTWDKAGEKFHSVLKKIGVAR